MKYPASEKLEIIRLVERTHLPVRRTLGRLGVSRPTFYRWYDLYRRFGEKGLEDHRSGPGRAWNRIPDKVRAVCADITRPVELPDIAEGMQRVVFYPGSSIGNYEPGEAVEFLSRLAEMAGHGGSLLIGVDLEKDSSVLDSAYNDANGVTADINLNLLHRINRELDGNIDVDRFRHHAFYNEDEGRIEMHLVSECTQTLRIDGHSYDFSKGESIHTENSYKYTIAGFRALAEQAGFRSEAIWLDDEALFSLHYLSVDS